MTIRVMLLFAAKVCSCIIYFCTCVYTVSSLCSSDIDECTESDSAVCEQICTNTIGGYDCSCMAGYKLNLTDNSSCDGINFFFSWNV